MKVALGSVVKRAVLINDFVAVGLGLTVVPDGDITTLHSGSAGIKPGGVKACAGAGTGLGEVYLTNQSTNDAEPMYVAFPSGVLLHRYSTKPYPGSTQVR